MGRQTARRTVLYLTQWNVQALHEGIVAYAHETGWILDNTMCYTGVIPEGVRADGIICRHSHDERIVDFTRSLGVPAVGFEGDDRLPIPLVYYDEEAIGAMAARHLIEREFKVLCFLHLGYTGSQMVRMTGFRREAEAAGCQFLELCPAKRPKTWHPPPGEAWDWLRKALEEIKGPVGIMVTNDQVARPAIDALVDIGYDVPTWVAVVSAENDPMICSIAGVTISSVDTNTRRMGYEAAHLLDRMMDGEAPARKTLRVTPTHVETRESSDIRAIANVHAAEALHYIWQHYREPIRAKNVVDVVGVTRRHLQALFRQEVGRTMLEETTRVRTARACYLLKSTALKIYEVAAQSGFSSSLHLHRTCQSAIGMGPKAFRESGTMPGFGVVPASVFAGCT